MSLETLFFLFKKNNYNILALIMYLMYLKVLLMLRIYRWRCTLYILKFDLSTDPWESGDGLEIWGSGDGILPKNQPNPLKNKQMATSAREPSLTALAGDLWPVKL